MQVGYAHYPAVTVDDGEPFHGTVVSLLDTINGLPVGQRLLGEIQNSGKQVAIAPLRAGRDFGNKCVAQLRRKFVRLRQALEADSDLNLAAELTDALQRAERAGYGRRHVARHIVNGLPPATVRTVNNLVMPPETRTIDELDIATDAMDEMIRQLADGTLTRNDIPQTAAGTYGLDDQLVRVLRPWLQRGTGANCAIYFDPNGQQSCCGEHGMRWRPPGIGLAHELCHAWRNATGNRLFDDAQACGLDDDEVMTTGIPPYVSEPFSENLFRAVWPLTIWQRCSGFMRSLPMRPSYR